VVFGGASGGAQQVTFPVSSWDGANYYGAAAVGSSQLWRYRGRCGKALVDQQLRALSGWPLVPGDHAADAALRESVRSSMLRTKALWRGQLLDHYLLGEPIQPLRKGEKFPSDEEFALVRGVAHVVRQVPEVAPYLVPSSRCAHQVSVRWQESSELWCRARYDILALCEGPSGLVPVYLDLKFLSQVDPDSKWDFTNASERFGFRNQQEHYRRGYATEWGDGEPLPTSEQLREPGFEWKGQELQCGTLVVTQPDRNGVHGVAAWIEWAERDTLNKEAAAVAEALEDMARGE
jgi:hypothetical protein